MKVKKKIKKIKKKVKKVIICPCKGKGKVKVFSLKRKHFKNKLTSQYGFGYQDMKDKPKKLFNKLIDGGYNVYPELVNTNKMVVDLYVIL
jgi:hypothetical protein